MRRLHVVAAALTLVACAHGSAEDRQLAALREDLARIEADHDKLDQRMSALEAQGGESATAPAGKSASAPAQRPAPRTLHLDADGAERTETDATAAAGARTGDDPDDPSPRPVIKVHGAGGKRGRGGSDVVEQTLPDEGATAPATQPSGPQSTARPSALDPEARRAYDQALSLVNARNYAGALDAFATFLVRWPDHPYADNATYWRGECYFAQGEFARAAEQFEGTIARFPLGNKVPDAWLKLGMCQQKLGNATKARAAFDRLEREYPKSDAARRIPRTENP